MSTRKPHNRRQRLERNCRALADRIYDAMGAWPVRQAA